ncbi:unnamed protein product [Miscanthus lutarioriparius]|uniref:Uncharacterized protein n=1 Tax=Miscanthus lutarioriparius TaxID=422564 RepID=A0A811RT57_9POAL|nr:unnamed protein product [Miscanthus lutarioriparius]
MGNRVARLVTPCFAPPADGHAADDAHHYTEAAGAADDGTGVCHILSFDGRDGRIHGVLLPSNQSTSGGSVHLSDRPSFSGSSSFDSSNSFSFRTLQPRQYSGPLDSYGGGSIASPSTSTSATNSGVSSVPRLPARTDEQILADLYATRRRRRQCLRQQ